ncbi:DNA-binding SARP family transcriptional activator [Actinokineospora cianjurensis]|uniref:DNA-binding SARP family transcriptional activator n=2 Tax=Actinokineospora cianjurensis TaxID=585224 RepID=A0A421B117_9PSEU|nr:DNA-binding SARP family transcriptional activator [Actinokineospora cianjurensis]
MLPASARKPMTVHLLGPVEISADDGDPRLHRRKQRLLLALLAACANRVVPVERIIDVLWEDDPPPPTVRNQVHVHVGAVRRALTAATGDPGALETTATGYLLHSPPVVVDVREFEDAVAAGVRWQAAGQQSAASAAFAKALACWRGAPLVGLDGRYAAAEAARLRERWLFARERQTDIELALGRHAELLPVLAGLLEAHPLHEGFRRSYMIALYRCGRVADALAAYRDGRRLLTEELGIEPTAALREVQQAILRGAPADRLAAPVLATAPPRQLPAEASPFVGRDEVLARIDAMTAADRDRVPVVLTGPAGVGKTAVCTRWAHRVRDRFPDGELYVDLRGSGPLPLDPAAVLARFLRALGMAPDRVPADCAEAAAEYRSLLAPTKTLVVLDDAASAEQVRPLLPGTRSCQVLVTSRHDLAELEAGDGAARIALPDLSSAEAQALVTVLAAGGRAPVVLASLSGRRPVELRRAAARLSDRMAEGRGMERAAVVEPIRRSLP